MSNQNNNQYNTLVELGSDSTMSNENDALDSSSHITTIHDFDFDLICEYFSTMERQGPGSDATTLRALSFIEGLSADSLMADLGCGTGGQTMALAKAVRGHITAIDLFPQFIDILRKQAELHDVGCRVSGMVGSMDALPFAPESLDLIWCEGAIYNIGFERGLQYWHEFLKCGGYVVISENTWFADERPAEIEEFWNAAYPEIDTVPHKIATMQRTGYEFIASFKVPEQCWWDFYEAQKTAKRIFLANHAGEPAAEALMAGEEYERGLYEKYRKYWGYAFYIGRKA